MIGLCCLSSNRKLRTSKTPVAKILPSEQGPSASSLSFGLNNNQIDGPNNPESKMNLYDSPESKMNHEFNQDNRSTGVVKVSLVKQLQSFQSPAPGKEGRIN